MRKNLKRAALAAKKNRPGKTGAMPQEPSEALPRVVIVGAGFGGFQAARALRNVPVQVTVIDRSNHHVFQPLLYQVATAAFGIVEMGSLRLSGLLAWVGPANSGQCPSLPL
jgi:NADPH-dependent 2,4-dienoyl-CoA reductase/sulfur reductase-like enzyme